VYFCVICDFSYCHRLSSSSSLVLKVTSLFFGKAKNLIPHRIQTPDLIETKFRTVDYVSDMAPCAQFFCKFLQESFSANG